MRSRNSALSTGHMQHLLTYQNNSITQLTDTDMLISERTLHLTALIKAAGFVTSNIHHHSEGVNLWSKWWKCLQLLQYYSFESELISVLLSKRSQNGYIEREMSGKTEWKTTVCKQTRGKLTSGKTGSKSERLLSWQHLSSSAGLGKDDQGKKKIKWWEKECNEKAKIDWRRWVHKEQEMK